MGLDVVVRAKEATNGAEQFPPYLLGLITRAPRELVLIEEDLPAHDFVNPLLVDVELTEGVRDVAAVSSGNVVGG